MIACGVRAGDHERRRSAARAIGPVLASLTLAQRGRAFTFLIDWRCVRPNLLLTRARLPRRFSATLVNIGLLVNGVSEVRRCVRVPMCWRAIWWLPLRFDFKERSRNRSSGFIFLYFH